MNGRYIRLSACSHSPSLSLTLSLFARCQYNLRLAEYGLIVEQYDIGTKYMVYLPTRVIKIAASGRLIWEYYCECYWWLQMVNLESRGRAWTETSVNQTENFGRIVGVGVAEYNEWPRFANEVVQFMRDENHA